MIPELLRITFSSLAQADPARSQSLLSEEQVRTALSNLVYQLPVLVVCLVCLIVVCAKWQQLAGGAVWALLGFGLTILLGLTFPFVQTAAMNWARNNSDSVATSIGMVGLFYSVLRGVSYVFLLVGLVTGRAAANQPPQYYPPQNYPPPQQGQYR